MKSLANLLICIILVGSFGSSVKPVSNEPTTKQPTQLKKPTPMSFVRTADGD